MSTKYGTAACQRHDDGTVTVLQADRVIGMTRDTWESLEPPHKQYGGRLQLDTEGKYVYAYLEVEYSPLSEEDDVITFRRIDTTPADVDGGQK